MKFSAGFTLVELLVVIAIMAIIGVFTLANYRSFGEDQNLKNASLDIQSILRQAQTGATTNAICNTQSGATWQVVFVDNKTINLNCLESVTSFSKKPVILGTNITIQPAISGIGSNCPAALPFTISFTLLSGKMDFGDANCSSLTITLKNDKTGTLKSLSVGQGGGIYGQ